MNKNIFMLAIGFVFLLSSCTPSGEERYEELSQTNLSPQAWIDAPLDESYLPFEPYEIVVHATDQQEVLSAEISVDDIVLATIPNPDDASNLATIKYIWTPESAGKHVIAVRGQGADQEWSNFSYAVVYIADPEETNTACVPDAQALENATCRVGSSVFHTPATYLMEGESALVTGRNVDSSWWLVQIEGQEEPCWISGKILQASCVSEELPVVESGPYFIQVSRSTPEIYWGDYSPRSVVIETEVNGESPVVSVVLVYHQQGKPDWRSTALVHKTGDSWEGAINALNIPGYRDITSAILEYYFVATSENGLETQSGLFTDIKLKKKP